MRKRSMVSGLGAISLILVLFAMVMSILGVYSLMNARADYTLAEKTADLAARTFALNAKAERTLAALDAAQTAAERPKHVRVIGDTYYWEETDGEKTLKCVAEFQNGQTVWLRHILLDAVEEQ